MRHANDHRPTNITNETTRRFPRTLREAFGLSREDAVAIHIYRPSPIRRILYWLMRYGFLLIIPVLFAAILFAQP